MADNLRILIADKLAKKGVDFLQASPGVQVDVKPGLTEDQLAAEVGAYDGMIVRSGAQVTAKVLQNPGKLKAIARAGVGVDNIDLPTATSKGILVMNSAEASTITTAEHAFTLLMALARNIGPAYLTMTKGGWSRDKYVGVELRGKTLGIVGFGRIGQTVAARALAFDMKVVAFDPVFQADSAMDGKVKLIKSFDDLVAQVDFLSFHVPLNDHTRNMLNADRFAKCRKGMMVVNAARGGVIDLEALVKALDEGKCGGAALDVFEVEPLEDNSPLRAHPKILLTPHLGASTNEAQEGVSTHACEQLLEYLTGQGLRGAVNAPGVRMDLDPTQLLYVDLVNRMAKIIAPMCEDSVGNITVTLQGAAITGAANTIEAAAVSELLNSAFGMSANFVNVKLLADQRKIQVRTIIEDTAIPAPRLKLEIVSGSKTRYIVGSIYADGLPRVLEINGYHMDIVPAGPMLIILNEDKPGMVGMIGTEFGSQNINIADMALSHRGNMAMMVIKFDQQPDKAAIARLLARPGILKAVSLGLPALPGGRKE